MIFFLLFNKNHMHDLIFSNIDMNEKSSIKPRKTSLIVSNHDDLIQFLEKQNQHIFVCMYRDMYVRISFWWTGLWLGPIISVLRFFFWGGWYFYKQVYAYSPATYMSESLLQCSLYVVIFKMTWLTALKFELQKKDCN